MVPKAREFKIGDPIPEKSYTITKEVIDKYTIDAVGRITKNIHTDDDAARKAGLPRAIAQSRYAMCYISERMIDLFGTDWFLHGELSVALTRFIFPGDTVTVKGYLKEKEQEKLFFEVWVVNQNGEKVMAGTASLAMAAG